MFETIISFLENIAQITFLLTVIAMFISMPTYLILLFFSSLRNKK